MCPVSMTRKTAGFTLIELVMSIALMAIVATISVGFVQQSSQGMIDSSGRQQLAATGYVVNEQVSRAVRDSLPGSVRTTPDGQCVEYMPVLAASIYTDLQVGVQVTQMSVVPSERRFYLAGAPETICQDGNYLYRYRNYGFISDVNNLRAALPASAAAGRSVLAYPLQSNSMDIRYQPATLQRNGLVTIEFVLQHPDTGEVQVIAQQIRINNVP